MNIFEATEIQFSILDNWIKSSGKVPVGVQHELRDAMLEQISLYPIPHLMYSEDRFKVIRRRTEAWLTIALERLTALGYAEDLKTLNAFFMHRSKEYETIRESRRLLNQMEKELEKSSNHEDLGAYEQLKNVLGLWSCPDSK